MFGDRSLREEFLVQMSRPRLHPLLFFPGYPPPILQFLLGGLSWAPCLWLETDPPSTLKTTQQRVGCPLPPHLCEGSLTSTGLFVTLALGQLRF